jgi:hypothetical protein
MINDMTMRNLSPSTHFRDPQLGPTPSASSFLAVSETMHAHAPLQRNDDSFRRL